MIKSVNINKLLRLMLMAMIVFIAAMCINTDEADAGSWHKTYLSPGQTYNVSDAKWNTTVYINKPGDYTLKGSSTKCKVVVQSGGVNIYLEDGLKIDPDSKANIGVQTASLIIEDMDGTVKLISKKGAHAYFGGYLCEPAIKKEGYNSKLVFETEDPLNPGTITAYRSHSSSSAGIGSAYKFSGRVSTGNIEINSGNIIATGGYMSAGIGGGGNGNAYYITINGGNVRAVGGKNGTGIGGGYHGNAYKITVNGGTIYAEGFFGAGIGSGEQASYAKKVVINGGKIEAKSTRGAGIGGGHRAEVEELRINGGNIKATGETGIGGSAYQHYGNVKSMYITGGEITAVGTNVGIGASTNAPGPNNIYISGGYITAEGIYAIGGGGMSGVGDDNRITNVTVTGGTIIARGETYDFGGVRQWLDEFNLTITGGSVLADADKILGHAKNQFGNDVYRTDIKLEGLDKQSYVSKANITKYMSGYLDYGLNDVKTTYDTNQNGQMLYFWVYDYERVKTVYLDSVNDVYRGTVFGGETGTLYKDATVIIESDGEGLESGSGTLYNGANKINNLIAPEISKGYTLTGYKIKGTDTPIADADGNLNEDVTGAGVEYTNAYGEWIREGSEDVYFVAATEENSYTITFDANPPENTKSIPYPNGNMNSVTVKYTEPYELPCPAFSLKGYTFAGWATTPDLPEGNPPLEVGNKIASLATSGTVTLYAQWTPQKYEVKFDANGGTGTMDSQEMTYDQTANLNPNTFTREDYRFIGWMRSGVAGGTLRPDESAVVNLCNCSDETNEANGYTLLAQWVPINQPAVMVTIDGKPKEDLQVFLVATPSDADASLYDLEYNYTSKLYTLLGTDALPNGEYDVRIDDKATGKTITIDGENDNTYAAVEYYSVSFEKDGNIESTTDYMGQVLAGTEINISATATTGYKFDEWITIECAPEYVQNTSASSASAAIIVNEKTTLKATSKPIEYQVAFEGNRPEETSGNFEGMMFEQEFVYDTAQKLDKNVYALQGYTFTGWNTKADGSGTAYSDRQEAKNLTSVEDETVILYAQWEADDYNIHFHGNGADSGQMSDLNCKYDKEFVVPACGYSKEDYHFLGWCSEIDGIGTYYYPGDKVKNLAFEDGATIVLYAIWEHDYYTVKFDSGDDAGQVPDLQVWTKEELTLSNPGFSKEGYQLTGYNTAPDGTGTSYEVDDKVSDLVGKNETITLYAQWTPLTYEVTFDANGGKGTMEPQKMTYDAAEKLDANSFKAPAGKKFAGWLADDGNDQTEDVIYEDQAEVVNLCQYNEEGELTGFVMTAQWKAITNAEDDESSNIGDDNPGTGDDSPLGLILAIMLVSFASMITIARKCKK